MGSVYDSNEGTGQASSVLYSPTGLTTGSAVLYVTVVSHRQYMDRNGCEIVSCEYPALEIHDTPDSDWHLPPCAPNRESARPVIHHSPRRDIAPIQFRYVRCQQRRREPRTRSC